MAKLFSSRAAEKVASKVIEVHGGYGFTREYPVEKYFRDQKVGQIYEGTTNMQLLVIAKQLLGQDVGVEGQPAVPGRRGLEGRSPSMTRTHAALIPLTARDGERIRGKRTGSGRTDVPDRVSTFGQTDSQSRLDPGPRSAAGRR